MKINGFVLLALLALMIATYGCVLSLIMWPFVGHFGWDVFSGGCGAGIIHLGLEWWCEE